jgi:hypothetical protein
MFLFSRRRTCEWLYRYWMPIWTCVVQTISGRSIWPSNTRKISVRHVQPLVPDWPEYARDDFCLIFDGRRNDEWGTSYLPDRSREELFWHHGINLFPLREHCDIIYISIVQPLLCRYSTRHSDIQPLFIVMVLAVTYSLCLCSGVLVHHIYTSMAGMGD